MGHYGSKTPKRQIAWSNASAIGRLNQGKLSWATYRGSDYEKHKTAESKVSKSGKKTFTGRRKQLKDSQCLGFTCPNFNCCTQAVMWTSSQFEIHVRDLILIYTWLSPTSVSRLSFTWVFDPSSYWCVVPIYCVQNCYSDLIPIMVTSDLVTPLWDRMVDMERYGHFSSLNLVVGSWPKQF